MIDALDQCRNLKLPEFLECMTLFVRACQRPGTNFRIFISVRDYPKYTTAIRSLAHRDVCYWIRADLKLEKITNDIKLYIKEHLTTIGIGLALTHDEIQKLNFRMAARQDHNFLCVSLILKNFSEHPPLSIVTMIATLEDIPKDLEDYYTRALGHCPEPELARRIFAAVISARRPLTLLEIGLFHEPHNILEEMEPNILARLADRIRQTCGLLVNIVDGRVYLIHNSLRKFLLRPRGAAGYPARRKAEENLRWKRSISEAKAERMLTAACIMSLTASAPIQAKCWAVLRLYAIENWAWHLFTVLRLMKGYCQNQMIEKMVGLGLDTKLLDSQGKSLLHHAVDDHVYTVDTNLVLTLLHHGALVQSADRENMTCLHYAAYRNNTRLIKILLDAGFNINEGVKRSSVEASAMDADAARSIGKGLTALHAAAHFCSLEALHVLLDAGADSSACDELGRSPLHLAVSLTFAGRNADDMWSDPIHTMEEVEDWGDEVAVEKVLRWARKSRQAVLECLCNTSTMVSSHRDIEGRTALHCVPYDSHRSACVTVSYLLEKGHSRLAQDVKGRTPIHLAARAGDALSLQRMIRQAKDLAIKDVNGCNALHFAAHANALPIVQIILENTKGLQLHQSLDYRGWNALHYALDGKSRSLADIQVVQELIAAGVDTAHKDCEGRDPLTLYLVGPLLLPGKPDIIQTLIDTGTDVRYRGGKFESLAHLFVQSWTEFEMDGFLRLQEAGVDIWALDAQGQTVLHYAGICGSLNSMLLSHFTQCMGMDADLPDLSGRCAWDYVVKGASRRYSPHMWMPERWKHSKVAFERYRQGLGRVCQCQSFRR